MKLLFALLLLVSAPALAEEAIDADPCSRYASSPPSGGPAPEKANKDRYQYSEKCALGESWKRVESNSNIKRLLTGLGNRTGQVLSVYSCFRAQLKQDEILCRNKCAPRFGDVQCEGRIAANLSEHTVGIAADVKIKSSLPPQPDMKPEEIGPFMKTPQYIAEVQKYCRILDANRRALNGGKGGLTIYGIDPKTGIGYVHMDVKADWCNWGVHCESVLGVGHCKRTMFRAKVAKLEQQLVDARIAEAEEDVMQLKAKLKALKSYCPPGDLSCRDSFK